MADGDINYKCFETSDNYWQCFQADPRTDPTVIKSGLRHTANHSCQYFIKGLPGICTNWSDEQNKCTATRDENGNYPTGYTEGSCDNLGRRSWCNKYNNEGNEDLEEYVCIAPCFERSGLGIQVEGVDYPLFRPVPKSEITGYNEGKCDGSGLGRGPVEGGTSLEELLKLKRVCNYYRPYDMGFGYTEPQPILIFKPFDCSWCGDETAWMTGSEWFVKKGGSWASYLEFEDTCD
jgi:hypothetical protein